MPSRRTLSHGFSVLSLIGILFLGLTLLAPLAAASSSSSFSPLPPSPSAEVEMLCSPTDHGDCYPKIFVPMDEFQVVREEQEIPPGLHIRLNVNTGEKEAKLYDPTEADDPALEGPPVDGALLVVEPEEGSEEEMKVVPPPGAPEYEPVGKIKEPQEQGSVDDYSAFGATMSALKETLTGGKVDTAQALVHNLEILDELAHDIYYGLKITEDEDALKALFCLMNPSEATKELNTVGSFPEFQAASILAGATQNNPTALAQVAKKWPAITALTCPGSKAELGGRLYNVLASTSNPNPNPRFTKAKTAALSGLVRDKDIKMDFLAKGGMSRLLEVILQEGTDWEGAKTKVSHFVQDNFLDESMGAVLGVWPPPPKEGRVLECEGADMLSHGCWAYHVGKEAATHNYDDPHWSRELYFKLTGEQSKWEGGHDEL